MATQDQISDYMDQVTWHGLYFKAVCPFHDDREPSLLVFEDGYNCLGCQRRGTLDELWRRVSGRGVGRPATHRRIRFPQGDRETFLENAHNRLLKYPDLNYGLRERGLDGRIVPAKLGWWEGWYTIPLRPTIPRAGHQPYALRATAELESYTNTRYAYPPDQAHVTHVPFSDTSRESPVVFITYGLLDAEAIAALGFSAATSTKGKRLSAEDLFAIRKPMIVLPDRGEESEARILAGDLGWRGSYHNLPYTDGSRFIDLKDPADFMRHPHDQAILTRTLQDLVERKA